MRQNRLDHVGRGVGLLDVERLCRFVVRPRARSYSLPGSRLQLTT